MRRGDVVLAVFAGDCGKPRPAVVVQTDLTLDSHASVPLCPITSTCLDAPLFRLDIGPGPDTGLEKHGQIMVDKIGSLRRERLRKTIGRLDQDALTRLGRALTFWRGIG